MWSDEHIRTTYVTAYAWYNRVFWDRPWLHILASDIWQLFLFCATTIKVRGEHENRKASITTQAMVIDISTI